MSLVIWRDRAALALASIALGCACLVAVTGPAAATPTANAHGLASKSSWPATEASPSAHVPEGGAIPNVPLSANSGHIYANVPKTGHVVTSSGIDDPMAITAGPDGALWFTNYGPASIGRITTTGTVTSYTDPRIFDPIAIATGPDGGVWFTTVNGTPSIGRIDPTTGAVTSYAGSDVSSPIGITAGPDGALWFTNEGTNVIGRITTGGTITGYTDSSINGPFGITRGPDGALWFTNSGNGSPSNSIGRIDPTTGAVTNYADPSISKPIEITTGPDGALWFTNIGNNTIGRIDPTTGAVTNYADPSISDPYGIAAGPDGALWFTNEGNNTIGRISPSGTVTSYTAPGISFPRGITAGPDGALWFTNVTNNTIGKITTSGKVTIYPDVPSNTTLAATPNPSNHGQAATFTATVTPTDGGGTVAFAADGSPVQGCSGQALTLVSGNTYQAQCTTTALAVGSHAIEADYSGDSNYSNSSGTITENVNPEPTTTTLASLTNPTTYGQAMTFTATVGPTDGQGTVTFSRGTGKNKPALCTSKSLVLVGGSYQAVCTVPSLGAATYTIAAAYSGDSNYAASSATVQQIVNKVPTTTVVSSSINPSDYGQTVTFTAAVSSTDGAGTVTFWYAGNTIVGCTSTQLQHDAGSYDATCKTSLLPRGTDKVKAIYSGDKNAFASTGTVSQVVRRAMTKTTLKSSPNPSNYGATVRLTATSSPTDGGGTVGFSSNGHTISGCSSRALRLVGASYQAVCETSALALGTDTVKATYSGDAADSGSSGTVKQQVKSRLAPH